VTRIILSPCHDGLAGIDRARGPARLLDAYGRAADVRVVEPVDPAAPEAWRVFELARRLAGEVRAAVAEGAFPLVLAGDCNSCLGTVAGVGAPLGAVWFDAHADRDTPETSSSGSLDGMGLALLTGQGWSALRQTIPGLEPVDEANVVQVGVRDGTSPPRRSFAELRRRIERVYLHIDLDVLDPSEGTANQYALPGGLTLAELLTAVDEVYDRFEIAAAAVTAYNPDSDPHGRIAAAGARVIARLAG